MTANPMDYCPSEDDQPEPFEVPGVDDCDFLFSASDDSSTVYLRVHNNPEDNKFYGTATVESDHFCDDMESMAGPFDSSEDACRKMAHHFDWFLTPGNGDGEMELCEDTKKALRIDAE